MTEDEYRDLIERAHHVQELQRHPGWEVWQQHLARRVDAKKREMLGGFDSLEAYRYCAGWIEGCEAALDATGALERQRDREAERRKEAKAAA